MTINNQQRAERAAEALATYAENKGEHPDDSDLTDLLVDLMHLCDQTTTRNWEDALTMAEIHFNTETEEEDDEPQN